MQTIICVQEHKMNFKQAIYSGNSKVIQGCWVRRFLVKKDSGVRCQTEVYIYLRGSYFNVQT